MKKTEKTYKYYVTGMGQFPEDMLRYDRGKINTVVTHAGGRRFYLIESKSPPTEGRWQSFLWTVVQNQAQYERWGLPTP